jgi:hypothetical protein
MATLPPLGSPNSHLADALKQLSAVKYGRHRNAVEEEIFARMKTITPPPPAPKPYTPPPSASWAPPAQPPAAKPAGASSFLDEWLQKRQQTPASVYAPPNPKPHSRPAAPPAQSAPAQPPAPPPPAIPQPTPPPAETAIPLAKSKVKNHEHHELVIQPPAKKKKKLDLKNISSEQLDQEEIGEIAEAIKQDLKPKPSAVVKPAPQPKKSEAAAPRQPVQPKAQPKAESNAASEAELELKLPPKKPQTPEQKEGAQEANDTITIDEHGNITFHEPEAKE